MNVFDWNSNNSSSYSIGNLWKSPMYTETQVVLPNIIFHMLLLLLLHARLRLVR